MEKQGRKALATSMGIALGQTNQAVQDFLQVKSLRLTWKNQTVSSPILTFERQNQHLEGLDRWTVQERFNQIQQQPKSRSED